SQDVPFDAQTGAVLNQTQQRLNRPRDDVKLAVEPAASLTQLIVVGESQIETFKFRVIPQQFRLFSGFDPPHHTVLHQQHVADQPHQGVAVRSCTPFLLKCGRKRLDAVEYPADARLVVGQDKTLSKRICDELKTFDGQVPDEDSSCQVGLRFSLRFDLQACIIDFRSREWSGDVVCNVLQKSLL